MPLDSRTVDRIFTRLLAAYGSRWLTHIQGVPEQLLRTDWATVLDGVPAWRIDHALEVLDDGPNPPTSRMFRQWCMRSPEVAKPKQPAIEDKRKRDPGRLAAELQRLHALLSQRKPDDVWVELKRRKAAGENLTPAQLQMLRDATDARGHVGGGIVQMTPIPHEHLPPAMRAEIPPPLVKKGLL